MTAARNSSKDVDGPRVGLIVSRFNSLITDKLLEGAMTTLEAAGLPSEAVTVVHVPGAFEIPLAARRLAASGNFDAVICLGCLIQGETDHYHYIAAEVTRGIQTVSLECDVPVTFGVITARSAQQAFDRAGGDLGNKGIEATEAALDMLEAFPRGLKGP